MANALTKRAGLLRNLLQQRLAYASEIVLSLVVTHLLPFNNSIVPPIIIYKLCVTLSIVV